MVGNNEVSSLPASKVKDFVHFVTRHFVLQRGVGRRTDLLILSGTEGVTFAVTIIGSKGISKSDMSHFSRG